MYGKGSEEPSEAETTPEDAPENRRKHRRKAGLWSARIETGTGAFSCAVLNVSRGGAMLLVSAPVFPRQQITVVIERFGMLRAEVIWRVKEKNKIGVRFTDTPEQIALVFGNALPE